jgi:hypothetical protein
VKTRRSSKTKPVAPAATPPVLRLLVALLLIALGLTACGSSSHGAAGGASGVTETHGHSSAPQRKNTVHATPKLCARIVAGTLGETGRRIYEEAHDGGIVAQAVQRVGGSTALATAVSSGDKAAAEATLHTLLAGQIVRAEILKDGKPFASVGSGNAIAPVRGSIGTSGASFLLSTQAAQSYVDVTEQVTGAEVVLYRAGQRVAGTIAGPPLASVQHDGPLTYAGRKYQASSLTGTAYPSGPLRIVLLVPAQSIKCPGSSTDAVVETLGHVGERIYHEEAGSPYVRATLRHIEADAAFQQAVATRDTKALRAAVVGLFGAHIHVVRVRAYAVEPSGAERFLYDLGGPYVLAPVHGIVRSGGKLVGRFSFAIQDDAGYLRLARLFTGADVLMRVGPRGEHQTVGTLDPGPATVPDRGPVSYHGKRYQAYSFSGVAFPSGPLRISLLSRYRPPIGG